MAPVTCFRQARNLNQIRGATTDEIRSPHRRRPPRHRRGLVCRRGADERAAAARRLRQRRPRRLLDPGPHRRFAQHGAAETAGAAPDRRRALAARVRDRADIEAQSGLSRPHHPRGDADRLSDRRRARHRPRRRHRLNALARAVDDALDRRLADGADHRARADDRRHPQPVRHHRRRAEGGDRRLSVVLPDHRRHGQRLPLARSAAARSHAHLFGDADADFPEASRAGERAVLLRQHEDRRGGGACRRRSCGGDEERGRRPGRAPARGLLLRPGGADLGRPVRRGRAVGGPGRRHRPHRAPLRASHGLHPMTSRRLAHLLPPLAFGLAVLMLWEAGVRLLNVPTIILPPPSAIALRFLTSIPTLAADFWQTIKGVVAGYVIGCVSGLIVAVLVDRSQFLQRGLLPLGNLVSALPIVGIAPIMVMWFGFDWQSKAAVVVMMTFFPMLVNTVAGLESAGAMERDLMKTYAANYWQTLLALRLHAALPFIFNALKINTTLAMIGAIVAEFFGTPTVGMGFRISTEVGHLGIDMVWATVLVAALTGSLFYALVAGVERRVTFWHASYRAREA